MHVFVCYSLKSSVYISHNLLKRKLVYYTECPINTITFAFPSQFAAVNLAHTDKYTDRFWASPECVSMLMNI